MKYFNKFFFLLYIYLRNIGLIQFVPTHYNITYIKKLSEDDTIFKSNRPLQFNLKICKPSVICINNIAFFFIFNFVLQYKLQYGIYKLIFRYIYILLIT